MLGVRVFSCQTWYPSGTQCQNLLDHEPKCFLGAAARNNSPIDENLLPHLCIGKVCSSFFKLRRAFSPTVMEMKNDHSKTQVIFKGPHKKLKNNIWLVRKTHLVAHLLLVGRMVIRCSVALGTDQICI